MRDQVAPSPTPGNFSALLPTLREHAFAINQMIAGAEVFATANLPAASPALNGLVIIEWTGISSNIIVYSNGIRTRFTGTNF